MSSLLPVILLPVLFSVNAWAQAGGGSIDWGDALEQSLDWYGGDEAIRVADNVLLYQLESGGWPKNVDMAEVLSEAEKARIRSEQADGETALSEATIDNGATYTQLRFLARAYEATGHRRFAESFLRGMDYLLEAQYENGGWPQYYPIREGYFEHITFNDDAMIEAMRLLRDVAGGGVPFAFVDEARRERAAEAIEKGLNVILATQIRVDGRLTAWCAQYDRETLRPAAARTYEHISISGNESVGIVEYLMDIESPSPEVIASVQGAVSWFDRVRLSGIRLDRIDDASAPEGWDRAVVDDSAAPSMWARFYEIGSNCPIFSSRDGIVRCRLREISHERRTGYAWLGYWPADLLEERYPAWQMEWAPDEDVRQVSPAGTVEAAGNWCCR